jgi:hypothetical protein
MAKGKLEQTGMTEEINSIPTFDDAPPLSTLTQILIPVRSSQQTSNASI